MTLSRATLVALAIAAIAVAAVSMSAAAAPGARPQLRAEEPQISSGAIVDQMIQSNPERFRARPGAEGPNAPPLGSSFDAIDFDGNAAETLFYQIPPDNSGAVGKSHLVNVVNSSIEIYTKAGVLTFRDSLKDFFAGATTPPTTPTFDPKVIHDQYRDRFVVTTMERIDAAGPTPNQSRVYFAVSDDSDPNGTWFFHTLNTEETIAGAATWADFPGLAVDFDAIYYTNNQFPHAGGPFAGQRLRIIAKAPFYTGGAAVATSYNPTVLATGGDGGAVATTMQPTHMYGDTTGGLGTYLLAYSGLNNGTDVFVQVIVVSSPLAAPTFATYFSKWGTIAANDAIGAGLASASQSGTGRLIQTNDRRFSQHGVFRGGLIYAAAPIRPAVAPDAGQTTAHYFVIDPAVIATTVSDPPPTEQGNIGGEDIAVNTYTFFPSVAVDSLGNLAIGFSASAPTIFPGSYYTVRAPTDAAGTTEPAGTLRAGLDYYIRDFTSSTTVTSRWGDYSAVWVDPSDDITFCLFNQHAKDRGNNLGGTTAEEDGRWRTAWGCFIKARPTAVTLRSFTASSSRRGVVLGWRTASDLAVLGYNIYGEAQGKRVRLNRSLISSVRRAQGGVYRFTYRQAPGQPSIARFWLQRVNTDGSRAWHGPARVRSR